MKEELLHYTVSDMTDYNKSSYTIFYHRFHIVWITKYRYRVLQGAMRIRIREIIAQAAEALGAPSS